MQSALKASFNEPQSYLDLKPNWVNTKNLIAAADRDQIETYFRHRIEALQAVNVVVRTIMTEWLADPIVEANTWVILTSDHGLLLGEHRLGGKGAAYEEAIRAPLYVRPPGGTSSAEVRDHLVTNLDLAPTILQIAGETNPEDTHGLDGKSFLAVIQDPVGNPPSSWRKRFLVEHWIEGDWIDPVFEVAGYDAVRSLRFDPGTQLPLEDIVFVDYRLPTQTDEWYNHVQTCTYPDATPKADKDQLCNLDAPQQTEYGELSCFLALLKECGNSSQLKCRDVEFQTAPCQ